VVSSAPVEIGRGQGLLSKMKSAGVGGGINEIKINKLIKKNKRVYESSLLFHSQSFFPAAMKKVCSSTAFKWGCRM